MLLAMGLFEKSYLNVTTVTFTSLIVAELLNIYTEVRKKKNINKRGFNLL